MADPRLLLALAGPARSGESNPYASLVMMGLIFAIFYFVLILPMRS
jgi:preprotein translocase subunit YajC